MGQAEGDQSDFCEHFAEVCTNTYDWIPISAADVQKLVDLNIPSQTLLDEVPPGLSPFTGTEPEQTYVFRTSKDHFQMV